MQYLLILLIIKKKKKMKYDSQSINKKITGTLAFPHALCICIKLSEQKNGGAWG